MLQNRVQSLKPQSLQENLTVRHIADEIATMKIHEVVSYQITFVDYLYQITSVDYLILTCYASKPISITKTSEPTRKSYS